jgi:excisionase family DNA binding protein
MLLNEFMTIDQLAETFKVSRRVVYRWRDIWGLPIIRLGSKTLVHEPAVAAWLKARERTADGLPATRNGQGVVADG